jgi:hypothetical protein
MSHPGLAKSAFGTTRSLFDVAKTAPVDGQPLIYSSSSGLYAPGAVARPGISNNFSQTNQFGARTLFGNPPDDGVGIGTVYIGAVNSGSGPYGALAMSRRSVSSGTDQRGVALMHSLDGSGLDAWMLTASGVNGSNSVYANSQSVMAGSLNGVAIGPGFVTPLSPLHLKAGSVAVRMEDASSPFLHSGLLSEQGGQLLGFGSNFSQLGGVNASYPTGLFRIDTRASGANLFHVVYAPASGGQSIVFVVSAAGVTSSALFKTTTAGSTPGTPGTVNRWIPMVASDGTTVQVPAYL